MNTLSRLIFRSSRSQFLWCVFIAALVIRIVIVISFGNAEHPQMYEHGDIANNLYQGNGYTMHWPYESLDSVRRAVMSKPPDHEGAFIPPINPYLIYGSYLLFGQTPAAITSLMLFYAICSALVIPVVYQSSRLLSTESGARWCSIISTLFLPAAYSVTTFSGSPLYHLFGALIVLFAIRVIQFSQLSNVILLGVCCGMMTLLRSEFFLLSFLLIALVVFYSRQKYSFSQKLKMLVVSAGVCMLIITPWTVRNYKLFDRFVPVLSHPWFEIWRGNNAEVASGSLFSKETYVWVNPMQFPEIIKKMDATAYDRFFEVRVNDIFQASALEFMKANPGKVLFLGAKKIFYLLTIDMADPSVRNSIYILSMLVVIPLTLFGLYKIITSKERRAEGMLFLLLFGYYLVITAVTFSLPRYQIYLFVLLMPLMGMVLAEKPTRSILDHG